MSDWLSDLEQKAKAASPGPWEACGDDRGGCKCGQVWSKTADHPVATVERDEWGDTFPTLKVTGTPTGIAAHIEVEAVLERIPYGNIPEVAWKGNMAHIAACSPETVLRLIGLVRLGRELAEMWENMDGAVHKKPVVAGSVKFELAAGLRATLAAFQEADHDNRL